MSTTHQLSSRRFIFLNYHSSAAQKLHLHLAAQGLCLEAITFDSSLVKKYELIESVGLDGIELVDTTSAWQSEIGLPGHKVERSPSAYNLDDLDKAMVDARLRLLTWITHRENYGKGITELQVNTIMNYSLNNALALLETIRPCLIVSLLAPCTPFDICIVALAKELGITTASLNEVNLSGFYYLTFNQFNHAQDIAALENCNIRSSEKETMAVGYLKSFLEETPYYISKDLQKVDSSLEQDQKDLGIFAEKSKKKAEKLVASSGGQILRYTSSELQRIGFISGRDLKHHVYSQAQKERMRADYIQFMKSSMREAEDKPAILILLDYYPEITRYPIGGDDYFYSNYFALAKILKNSALFNLCSTSMVYVKEHPAMLEVSNHSHPRFGLSGLMKSHGATFVSPLRKTTSLLLDNPMLVVITGVSNAGVEASLLGHTTVTTSKPWWLCMPNTYHCNVYSRKVSSFKHSWRQQCTESTSDSPIHEYACGEAERAYSSFILNYCVNLGVSMSAIDTLFFSQADAYCSEFKTIAKAIAARLARKSD
ncbi:hypothetical protein KBY70_05930 [Cyanobium sp. ATX 6E8]|uniref:hypothetical protein n=1 Tax=Cyanobium sp. ATX 6E8 TaxID=2823701 RepID=UPI0020CBF3D1|nr:hypothetical protein [Cyanobium sp. ATX 6E8]MCP9941925.1 hypothetical protein [Cyanobium sp. ATX 6E8]